MDRGEILSWLKEKDEKRLEELWRRADATRQANVGDEVHLRGLVEMSNYCIRQCGYCGIRSGNQKVERYRMNQEEIMACVAEAERYGFGTVVFQAGEDYGIGTEWLSKIIRRIKAETSLAVTLSLGERPEKDLEGWREAGADRYLLRFETSDSFLYHLFHPSLPGMESNRLAILTRLKKMGYQTGSGVMIGLPGQTYVSLADDIAIFQELDLDMVGVGPYIPHPATPVGSGKRGFFIPQEDQVPNLEEMAYKVIALTRMVCPEANIPSTAALATMNREQGRELGLMRGANVVMPNLTPSHYRLKYDVYPSRARIQETPEGFHLFFRHRIQSMGRKVGIDRGDRIHRNESTEVSHGNAGGG